MKEYPASQSLEIARESLVRASLEMAAFYCAAAAANMAFGLECWNLWHASRASRIIEAVQRSQFGGHAVIHAKFGAPRP